MTALRPLGRRLNHDPRSRAFAVAPTLPPDLTQPRTAHHRHWGPVLDQGNLGSCTGNALAQALNTTPLRRFPNSTGVRPLLTEDDALNIYRLATTLDPFPGAYPPDDTGSDGLDACKAAQQLNLIAAYTHAFSLNEALLALTHRPVITGVNWYDSFDRPDPATGLIAISPNAAVRGEHELVLIGLDVRRRVVVGINSWGPTWPTSELNGRFIISFTDLERLLAEDGDVSCPMLTPNA